MIMSGYCQWNTTMTEAEKRLECAVGTLTTILISLGASWTIIAFAVTAFSCFRRFRVFFPSFQIAQFTIFKIFFFGERAADIYAKLQDQAYVELYASSIGNSFMLFIALFGLLYWEPNDIKNWMPYLHILFIGSIVLSVREGLSVAAKSSEDFRNTSDAGKEFVIVLSIIRFSCLAWLIIKLVWMCFQLPAATCPCDKTNVVILQNNESDATLKCSEAVREAFRLRGIRFISANKLDTNHAHAETVAVIICNESSRLEHDVSGQINGNEDMCNTNLMKAIDYYAELVDNYETEYKHYHSKQIQGKQLHLKCCGETSLTVLDSRGSIQFTYIFLPLIIPAIEGAALEVDVT